MQFLPLEVYLPYKLNDKQIMAKPPRILSKIIIIKLLAALCHSGQNYFIYDKDLSYEICNIS